MNLAEKNKTYVPLHHLESSSKKIYSHIYLCDNKLCNNRCLYDKTIPLEIYLC